MTDIFTLGIKVDTTDIDRGKNSLDDFANGAETAEKKTGDFRKGVNVAGKAIAVFGVAAATALGAVTVSAGNTAREISTLARLSNDTVENFQRAAFAAKAYGIEQDKLSDIFKDTQDKVGDFLAEGGGELVQFFEEIAPLAGVTADQFRNLSGKDALQLYVSTLENANLSQTEMITHLERIASDSTLLQPLLANNGAEFQRLANRADELGIVLDQLDITNLNEMKMSLDELAATSQATGNIIGATFAPFVKDLTDKFNDNAVSADIVRETITTLIEVGVTVAGVFADAGRAFEIFGKALGATAFTLVESFDTMDNRLEQLGVNFELTFDELQLQLIEWVNEQDVAINAWASSMINAADVFDLFDDVTLEINTFGADDAAALEASITTLKTQAAGLEADLVQSNENIANAWQDVLDLMMQPLPSDGMDKWVQAVMKGVKAQRELQDEIKKTGKDNRKVVNSVSSDAVKWISNTKEVTKGLSTAFTDNEKAAKALHQVNLVIGIAEQAMILQKVFADSAATQTHMANSAAKASANATEAITAAATAPFPVGFAAAAAMIGLMASVLGGSGGSGGGGSGTTGTTLGGDPSESLDNSADMIADIMIDQLAELRGLRNDLDTVNDKSFGLLKQLLAVDVGHREIRNRTEAMLERSFDELSIDSGGEIQGSTTIATPFTDSLKSIFESVDDVISESMDILGVTTKNSLEGFIFDVGKISFDNLDADAAQDKLGQILSSQSDLMIERLLPFVVAFQKLGEGALETLTRLTTEQTIFNDNIAAMGFNLSELSNIMQIDVAQSIIKLIGGIDEFTSATEAFIDGFFSEAEKTKLLGDSLTDVFEGLGLTMTLTRGGFRDLVESMDLTSESGQAMFAALLEISPAMDDYIGQLEDQTSAIEDQASALQGVLNDAANNTFDMLQDTIELERERINIVLQGQRDIFTEEMKRITGVRAVLQATFRDLTNNVRTSQAAVKLAFEAEKSAIEKASATRIKGLNDERDALENLHGSQVEQISALKSLSERLRATLPESGDSARIDLERALTAAQAGDFSSALGLGGINSLSQDSGQFGTAAEFNIAQGVTGFRIETLASLVEQQATIEELTLSILEKQLVSIDEQIENEEKATTMQIALLKDQINAALDINTNVLSVDDSINALMTAQAALTILDFENQMLALAQDEDLATEALDQAEDAAREQNENLDLILNTGRAQLNALFNIDNSVRTVTEAVDNLNASIGVAAENAAAANLAIAKSSAKTANILQRNELNAEVV